MKRSHLDQRTVNILYLITGLNVGGAEMQVYQLIKKLKHYTTYNLMVVSLIEPGPVGEKLREAEIKVRSLQMKRGKINIQSLWKLNKIIKEERIHIIHSHLFHANILARAMKVFNPRIKIITTLHSINIGGCNRERFLRYTNFLSDFNTIISSIARKHFIHKGIFSDNNLKLIPNGVDTNKFRKDLKLRLQKREEINVGNTFIWLAVGRFEEPKNYPSLLKALAIVAEKNKNVLLLFAGTGPLLENIKKMAEELKVSKYVRFLEYRSDIPALMNAADAYVMSSSWEGMPLVLLEASSVGLPIVCTDVGGNKEVVVDCETGFLVEPDCHLSLAAKMNQLMCLSDREREVMGEKGTNYVKAKYGIDQVVENWREVYNSVLSRKVLNSEATRTY